MGNQQFSHSAPHQAGCPHVYYFTYFLMQVVLELGQIPIKRSLKELISEKLLGTLDVALMLLFTLYMEVLCRLMSRLQTSEMYVKIFGK